MKITVAQIEVVSGSPQENRLSMLKAIEKAKEDRSDVIVFPEMCVPGYLIGDNWERKSFIQECEEANFKIAKLAENIIIIWGSVKASYSQKGEDGRARLENCVFIAKDRRIWDTQTKFLQPNYREFDDDRHFYSARKSMADKIFQEMTQEDWKAEKPKIPFHKPLYIGKNRIQCIICEDGWDDDYVIKPLEHIDDDVNVILNLSCSPYTQGKNDKRNRVFSKHTKSLDKKTNTHVKLFYVNNVGTQNNAKTMYTFDGDSCVYSNEMKYSFFKPFEEGVKSVVITDDNTMVVGECYTSDNISDEQYLHMAITYACQKYCEMFGIKKVVIGASGGVDNSLVAAIFSQFIDKENLYLVNMPTNFNSNQTISAAEKLAMNIGCQYLSIPIQNEVNAIKNSLEDALLKKCDQLSFENIQARYRSNSVLAGIAQMVGGVFTCNGNKSEATVGYCTIGGDLMGFLAPVMDLWKHQIYDLCKWHNENIKNVIPEETLSMIPSAELSADQNIVEGKGDPLIYDYHDYLFMSWVEKWDRDSFETTLYYYDEGKLNEHLGCPVDVYEIFANRRDFVADLQRWWNLYDGLGIVKRELAPMIVSVSRRSYGFDLRETITKPHYYK